MFIGVLFLVCLLSGIVAYSAPILKELYSAHLCLYNHVESDVTISVI